MPRMMNATVLRADGSLAPQTVERPSPGPTEILIRTAAVGINPVDWQSADIDIPANDRGKPVILGWDVAGTVVELGPGVTRFSVGDRVFGMPKFPAPANAYADFVVARSREVARVPDNITDVEAGAVPLAALTAWQSIVDTLAVSDGDRLLIHAASGGVGHLAVQIAKARGAEVWGTASRRNHDALRDLGADHVIDYRSERFEEIAPAMDAVLDLVGDGDTATRSLEILRSGGRLSSISPDIPTAAEQVHAGITASFVMVEPDYAALEHIADMLAAGTLRVVIADTRPLANVAELHAIGRSGGPMGKLVATASLDDADGVLPSVVLLDYI